MDACIECVLLVAKDCPHCKKMWAAIPAEMKKQIRDVGVRLVLIDLVPPLPWMFIPDASGGLYVERLVTPSLICYDPATGEQLMYHIIDVSKEGWQSQLSLIIRSLWLQNLCGRPSAKGVRNKKEKKEGEEEGGKKKRKSKKEVYVE